MSEPLFAFLDEASSALCRMDADALEAMTAEAERIAAVCRTIGRLDMALLHQSHDRFAGLLDTTRNSLDLFSQIRRQEGANPWAR